VRKQVAHAALQPTGCSVETIDAIANDDASTPALMAGSAKFATLARQGGACPNQAAIAYVKQQGQAAGRTAPAVIARRTQRFDMRYLNLLGSAQPALVLLALKAEPMSALAFCGPPGTGKTQLAAELAQQLDRKLVVRTASDINSMWYGQSEANVAKMFRQCDPHAEILFLDEAEVLLASREQTEHRADRAVTAEFLRWLECFEGTFICATNHVVDLDSALMRRFTFRLQFLPMNQVQRQAMYAEQVLGWKPGSHEVPPTLPVNVVRRLERLDQLTPGDFANAGRRVRRLALPAEAWLDELDAEHAAKATHVGARIGFT
jgi:ATPase family associated with various cellular activities (AAA)